MKVVLDTNVVVSGLLSDAGPPGRILDGAVAGNFQVCVDDRLVAEYDDLLHRPRLKLDPGRVGTFLKFVRETGVRVECAELTIALPDADDLPFLEVAISAAAECVVTGNLKHFPVDKRAGVIVTSPAEFITRYGESQ